MNTVKQSKKSSLPSLPKRSFSVKRNNLSVYVATIGLASLLGTYLDLYFVGKQVYQFPVRPFPEIFSIHIGFTLVGLPLFTFVFLYVSTRMTVCIRVLFFVIMSLFSAILEKQAEAFGLFTHTDQWKHEYSIIGYFLFIVIIWNIAQFFWRKSE